MNTFIDLTDFNNADKIISVNASFIVSIEQTDTGGSYLHLPIGKLMHRVKESREEVLRLIGLCEEG